MTTGWRLKHGMPWDIQSLWLNCKIQFHSLSCRQADVDDGPPWVAATKQPIVGGIVIAKWQYVVSSIAGGSIHCDHADSVVSDAHGRYHINKWRYTTSPWDQLVEPHFVTLDAYKLGMSAVSPGVRHVNKTTAVLELQTSTVTHAQRMAWLHFLTYSSELKCGHSKDSEETLRAVREVVYTEAKSIATDSAEDQEAMMDIEQWRRYLAYQAQQGYPPTPGFPDQPAPNIKTVIGKSPQASQVRR
jgi:hypothetical protein